MKLFSSISTLLFMLASHITSGQTMGKTKDYLSIPGPISVTGIKYNLSWSSHPNAGYYKQEYIPANNSVSEYKTMLLIEVLEGEYSPSAVAASKVAELKKLKETNPVVQYEIFQKNGEFILDFLISEDNPDGKTNIIERNVYRYKSIVDKKGRKCLMLIGMSERGYGDEGKLFLKNLKSNKNIMLNVIAKFQIPSVELVQ